MSYESHNVIAVILVIRFIAVIICKSDLYSLLACTACSCWFFFAKAQGPDLEEHLLQDVSSSAGWYLCGTLTYHHLPLKPTAKAPWKHWSHQSLDFVLQNWQNGRREERMRLVKIDTFEGIMDDAWLEIMLFWGSYLYFTRGILCLSPCLSSHKQVASWCNMCYIHSCTHVHVHGQMTGNFPNPRLKL